MEIYSAVSGDGEKERMERLTSVRNIQPRPPTQAWMLASQCTHYSCQKFCLPILPYGLVLSALVFQSLGLALMLRMVVCLSLHHLSSK